MLYSGYTAMHSKQINNGLVHLWNSCKLLSDLAFIHRVVECSPVGLLSKFYPVFKLNHWTPGIVLGVCSWKVEICSNGKRFGELEDQRRILDKHEDSQ